MFFDMKGGVDELSDGQGCREERKDTTIKVIQELGHEREVRVCQDRENGGGKLSQNLAQKSRNRELEINRCRQGLENE